MLLTGESRSGRLFSGALAGYLAGETDLGAANIGYFDNLDSPRRRFDGLDQRHHHLVKRNQPKASGPPAGERQNLRHLVDGQQSIGPFVSGPEDVPGTKDGGVQTARADHHLAFRSHRNVRLHHGCRLGHAEIDEVREAQMCRRLDGLGCGYEFDGTEFSSPGRRRMGDAYQMNKRVRRANEVLVRMSVEGVPGYDFASAREIAFRIWPQEAPHMMTALQKHGN